MKNMNGNGRMFNHIGKIDHFASSFSYTYKCHVSKVVFMVIRL